MARTILAPGSWTMKLLEADMPRPVGGKTHRIAIKFLDEFNNTHICWEYVSSSNLAWLIYHGLNELIKAEALFAVDVTVKQNVSIQWNAIEPDWKFGKVSGLSTTEPGKAQGAHNA